MSDELVFYSLLSGLAAIAAYVYLVQAPDADPFVLKVQANITPHRNRGETAVYRSRITPFTGGLLSGLAIGKSAFSTRDGNLQDLWELAQKTSIGECSFGINDSFNPISNLSDTVSTVGSKLSNSAGKPIAVMLPNCVENLILTFAGALFNTPVVFIAIEDVSVQQIEEFLAVAKPSSVISTAEILEGVSLDSGVNTVVSVKGQIPGAVSWDELVSKKSAAEFPEYDETKTVVSFIYAERHTGKARKTELQNPHIVAAVAAQVKALPYSQQWKQSDLVLSCTSHLSLYTFVLHLAAIVAGSKLAFPEPDSPTDLFKLIEQIKPTVLISDDVTMKSLAGRAERLKLVGMIKLRMALATLSHGNLPSLTSVISGFKSVRLIHTSYNSIDDPSDALTTKETNTIRALTGACVIHALCSPITCSPLAQTLPYDYRNGSDDVINYGPVLPCLEAFLKDHGLYSAEDKKGQLWVRGPGDDVEWLNTGIIGQWGADGTLKLFA